jgi:hypothetical protein
MIGRLTVRLLAAAIGVVLWPVAMWDQWHLRRGDRPRNMGDGW